TQHLRMLVGMRAAAGADIAGYQGRRPERPLRDRAEARVGPVGRIAIITVIGTAPAPEIGVDPGFAKAVEAPDRRLQPGRIDPALGGEAGERVVLLDPALRDPFGELAARRVEREQIAFARAGIHHDPRRDRPADRVARIAGLAD